MTPKQPLRPSEAWASPIHGRVPDPNGKPIEGAVPGTLGAWIEINQAARLHMPLAVPDEILGCLFSFAP